MRGGRLDDQRADAIDRRCLESGIRCLYFLADADAATARAAALHGYREVDVRVTLRHGLEGLGEQSRDSPVAIREATERDLPELCALAARSHHNTRFYLDGGFPRDRCDALYASWVERGIEDPERTVLIPEMPGGPAGYEVVRHPDSEGTGRLELIAVTEDHSGRGLGRALLLSSLRLVADREGTAAVTVTQRRNEASISAHESVGFQIHRSEVWYHKWYPEPHGSR